MTFGYNWTFSNDAKFSDDSIVHANIYIYIYIYSSISDFNCESNVKVQMAEYHAVNCALFTDKISAAHSSME